MLTIQERVAAGIAYLDKEWAGPDWRKKIDVSTLNLSEPFNCIFG